MIVYLAVGTMALSAATGCATRSRTVTTESTYYSSREAPPPGDPAIVSERERRTTTTEVEPAAENTGVVSGTVNVIGEAVALPFRAVGGLLRAIF
jgi:hypothetical protein